jgi:calcineurin-like phosphoesterase family protein
VIGDPHFTHEGMCRFTNFDGAKMRPWDNVRDMDEALVANWNAVVAPEDRVYVMGDLAMNKRGATVVARCHGRKVLIKGNHDEEKLAFYAGLFDDVRAVDARKEFGRKFVMTHVPLHPSCLDRWGLNIHGHLHANTIKLPDGTRDPRYVCVSVEQIAYTPKLLEQVLEENPL